MRDFSVARRRLRSERTKMQPRGRCAKSAFPTTLLSILPATIPRSPRTSGHRGNRGGNIYERTVVSGRRGAYGHAARGGRLFYTCNVVRLHQKDTFDYFPSASPYVRQMVSVYALVQFIPTFTCKYRTRQCEPVKTSKVFKDFKLNYPYCRVKVGIMFLKCGCYQSAKRICFCTMTSAYFLRQHFKTKFQIKKIFFNGRTSHSLSVNPNEDCAIYAAF